MLQDTLDDALSNHIWDPILGRVGSWLARSCQPSPPLLTCLSVSSSYPCGALVCLSNPVTNARHWLSLIPQVCPSHAQSSALLKPMGPNRMDRTLVDSSSWQASSMRVPAGFLWHEPGRLESFTNRRLSKLTNWRFMTCTQMYKNQERLSAMREQTPNKLVNKT